MVRVVGIQSANDFPDRDPHTMRVYGRIERASFQVNTFDNDSEPERFEREAEEKHELQDFTFMRQVDNMSFVNRWQLNMYELKQRDAMVHSLRFVFDKKEYDIQLGSIQLFY